MRVMGQRLLVQVKSSPGFRLVGERNEVGYCRVIGNHVNTTDNHPGIRVDSSHNCSIHHNDISKYQGNSDNSNAKIGRAHV